MKYLHRGIPTNRCNPSSCPLYTPSPPFPTSIHYFKLQIITLYASPLGNERRTRVVLPQRYIAHRCAGILRSYEVAFFVCLVEKLIADAQYTAYLAMIAMNFCQRVN
jgi:hypothetical protein